MCCNQVVDRAKSVLQRNIDDWGDRGKRAYPVTVDEIYLFIRAGAVIVHLNKKGGHGIFIHCVKFEHKKFMACSSEEIHFGQMP